MYDILVVELLLVRRFFGTNVVSETRGDGGERIIVVGGIDRELGLGGSFGILSGIFGGNRVGWRLNDLDRLAVFPGWDGA